MVPVRMCTMIGPSEDVCSDGPSEDVSSNGNSEDVSSDRSKRGCVQ
jgi:hypothetical protein